ncbi:hypothetical protein [Hahella sp. HN01]|uniref:hypothetical protein n=1 Tax=Hahella sp. HN01 TaxID=2847262 RepID=UPI001C1EA341|nr:hypothetical protein [Hahella sp. HN01]MBU6955639.1 hypothetical protein [Hahella sp. HN01]
MDSRSQKSPQQIAEEAIRRYLPEYVPDAALCGSFETQILSGNISHKEAKTYRGLSLKEITRLMSQSSMEYQLKRMKSGAGDFLPIGKGSE